jgi:putative transposase
MVWKETCVMEERMRFVDAVVDNEEAFAAVCRRFGVSRRTGYKWLERYREEGVAGLADRSRAPLHHVQAITAAIAAQCLAARRAHPSWGPLKVRAFLEQRRPQIAWPAASTIGALFDREGLTVKRRLRRRSPPSSAPFAPCMAANDVWCTDFKGWFLTGDGRRCEPLTLSDAHSRYLLRCQALERSDTEHVWAVLDAAFREYGLPLRLRSDNGPPFASCGAGGLSQLSVKVIKAGVMPERIAPGKPQQNGRLERLHLTLLPRPPIRRRAVCACSSSGCAASSASTTNNARTRRSAMRCRRRITPSRRAASTAYCANPATATIMPSAACAITARSGGRAAPSMSPLR